MCDQQLDFLSFYIVALQCFYGFRSIKFKQLFKCFFSFHVRIPHTHAPPLHLGSSPLSREHKDDCTVFRKWKTLICPHSSAPRWVSGVPGQVISPLQTISVTTINTGCRLIPPRLQRHERRVSRSPSLSLRVFSAAVEFIPWEMGISGKNMPALSILP